MYKKEPKRNNTCCGLEAVPPGQLLYICVRIIITLLPLPERLTTLRLYELKSCHRNAAPCVRAL